MEGDAFSLVGLHESRGVLKQFMPGVAHSMHT